MPKRAPAYARMESIEKAYAFFRHMELNKRSFSAEDIACETGYKSGVVKIYLSKKWYWFLEEAAGEQYRVSRFLHVPYDYFLSIHSQVALPYDDVLATVPTRDRASPLVLLLVLLFCLGWLWRFRRHGVRIWRILVPLLV